MKTFDELYNELQSADNNELNTLWKEAKIENEKAKKRAFVICLVLDIVVAIIFFKFIFISIFVLPFILFFTLIFNLIIFAIVMTFSSVNKKNIEFVGKYKNIVIKRLLDNFYTNLEYFPNKQMPEYLYKPLNYENYDRYRSEDYFEALINNKYHIQMAEVITKEERRDTDGNTKRKTITKFHGLFAKIEMNKTINSEIKIGQNGKLYLGKILKMDSTEFQKHFDVQASDKIIGMQLLTADVMEELIDFVNKTKMQYDIFIKDNELYLRFRCGEMFEFYNFKKSVLDKQLIQKYFYMLNFTYNLSNKLINVVNETLI